MSVPTLETVHELRMAEERRKNEEWRRFVDSVQLAKGPMMRWNPNTSGMEPFNYSDDQRGSK
jgi:hypothetical protein